MALEAQASPPPRASDADPMTPTREAGPDQPATAPSSTPLPLSTAVVSYETHAAKYVPPRAASRTADPEPARGGWYSWNGGRTAPRAHRPRPDPPPPRQWPVDMPAPPRQRPVDVPAPPLPASPLAPAPPPAPAPAPVPSPVPASAPPPTRSVDRVVPNILSRKRRAAAMQRTALVARGAATVLCLAALVVLAADTRKGWALDSYSRYSQFRYSEAVNVIGFLYSVFQFAALAVLMKNNKHLIPHPKRDLFDFIMDQLLAYLLISSSSSATARVGDLIDNWGSDPFPSMANGSIAISFLAFLVFAICSLVSAYNLFRRDM